MSLKRVGKEISAADYWDQRSQADIDLIDGKYHTARLNTVLSMLNTVDLSEAVCVDFGCGEGILIQKLNRTFTGIRWTGIDINLKMLEEASRRLQHDSEGVSLIRGSVEQLGLIKSNSIDCLFALNVLAYFTDEEEEQFYGEVQRILKGGGVVYCHSLKRVI